MIAMIFEYWVDSDHMDAYRVEAEALRRVLVDVDGITGVERFESTVEAGKSLTMAYFEDERAVAAWRNTPAHRRAQALGRAKFFKDYRLRMAHVDRDYGKSDRSGAPKDSRAAHG